MKKFTAILLCNILLISFAVITRAENVAGLREKMDALLLKNNFTTEEITAMDAQYVDYRTARFWRDELDFIKRSGRYKTESKTDEDELKHYLHEWKADYQYAALAVRLNTTHYVRQYYKTGNLKYLFNNEEYWAVPLPFSISGQINTNDDYGTGTVLFSKNGEHILFFKDFPASHVSMKSKAWALLQDYTQMEQLLLGKGETSISEMKLFALNNYISFLYLRCDNREYLIKLHGSTDSGTIVIPQIELYKLYEAGTILEAFAAILEESGFAYSKGLAESIVITKPTFDTEAQSLQQDGLLKGNENGLDLLKPLTRIEAAAMLLRALGEPETAPDDGIQTFADVSSDHWGYGAAERAYSEGLIQGVGDNQFAPDKTVAATEFATMLLRASETGEFDWAQALNILIQEGVITKENAQTMDLFTRGDMAKIIYEAKEKGLL